MRDFRIKEIERIGFFPQVLTRKGKWKTLMMNENYVIPTQAIRKVKLKEALPFDSYEEACEVIDMYIELEKCLSTAIIHEYE